MSNERTPLKCIIKHTISASDVPQIVSRRQPRANSRIEQMRNLPVGESLVVEVEEGEAIDRVVKSFQVSQNELPYRPRYTIDENNRMIYITRDEGSGFVGVKQTKNGRNRRVTENEMKKAAAV